MNEDTDNIKVEEVAPAHTSTVRSLRRRDKKPIKFQDFIENEEEIFGDVLEEDYHSEESRAKKRKTPKKKSKEELAKENTKLIDNAGEIEEIANNNLNNLNNDIPFITKAKNKRTDALKASKIKNYKEKENKASNEANTEKNEDEIDNLISNITNEKKEVRKNLR